MKLSEIKGDRTLDVVAELIDPIATIAEDDAVRALIKREKAPKGTDPTKFLIQRLKKGIPGLIKGHKAELVAILSTINGVTPEEYTQTLGILTLTRDVWDLINDTEFLGLFTPAQSDGKQSGSAQESTEAPKA